MRRFDCVMLRDELGLLEARMDLLDDVVDVFVVVQGDRVFGSGDRRPFVALDGRFERWSDRIVTLNVRLPGPAHADGWERERTQRAGIDVALAALRDDDVVLVGDVDEFPTVEQVAGPVDVPVVCDQRHMVFAPNLEHPRRWRGTVIVRGRDYTCANDLRGRRVTLPPVRGGFHFSWMPNDEGYLAKLQATSHVEFAGRPISKYVARRTHLDGHQLARVEPDSSWPVWFRDGRCPAWWWAQ